MDGNQPNLGTLLVSVKESIGADRIRTLPTKGRWDDPPSAGPLAEISGHLQSGGLRAAPAGHTPRMAADFFYSSLPALMVSTTYGKM